MWMCFCVGKQVSVVTMEDDCKMTAWLRDLGDCYIMWQLHFVPLLMSKVSSFIDGCCVLWFRVRDTQVREYLKWPQGSYMLDGCVSCTAVMAYIHPSSSAPCSLPVRLAYLFNVLAHRWAKKGSLAFTWPLLNVKICDTKWHGFIFV